MAAYVLYDHSIILLPDYLWCIIDVSLVAFTSILIVPFSQNRCSENRIKKVFESGNEDYVTSKNNMEILSV